MGWGTWFAELTALGCCVVQDEVAKEVEALKELKTKVEALVSSSVLMELPAA